MILHLIPCCISISQNLLCYSLPLFKHNVRLLWVNHFEVLLYLQLEQDFKMIYPEKADIMLKRWQGIAEQVLRYADATGYQMEDHFDFELAASSWTQGNFCNSF